MDKQRAALAYAKRFNWRVFPIWWMKDDGACACGALECSRGKHPPILEWQRAATVDAGQIGRWWERWPLANIAVATGAESGLVVLDIDSRAGGEESLSELEAKFGRLPETPTVLTGGGGFHFFFSHPGIRIPNSASKVGGGIDVRGDGGYVLLPRSNHKSGRVYEWEVQSKIGDLPLAQMPDWLKAKIEEQPKLIVPEDDEAPVGEGERHQVLLRIAGRMRKSGLGPDEIEAALMTFNVRRCRPPSPAEEVSRIAHDIGEKPTTEAIVAATSNGRPQIKLNDRDYNEMLDEVWTAILGTNVPPTLFRKDDVLVRLRSDEDGVITRAVNEDIAYNILANRISWYKSLTAKNGAGIKMPTVPPSRMARSITADVNHKLPQLHLITNAPLFSPAGRLLDTAGYHPEAKAWIDLEGLQIRAVPDRPTKDEVAEALTTIHDELLYDFVFVGGERGAHYVNMLGLLLLPFTRPLIQGSTPLFFIESSTPGSGKTLLANVVKLVATGRPLPARVLPSEEEEVRKLITAELISGRPIVVFDNFEPARKMNSSTIAVLMTTAIWSDRVLGSSMAVNLPNRTIWILTGNNPNPGKDFLRRTCQIRLDPGVERPWERKGFRHPNLTAWIRSYRSQLIRALLILVQNWIAQGKPRGDVNLGGFEDWAQVTSGILQAAGLDAFMSNATEFYEAADWENEGLRAFVAAWFKEFGEQPMGAGELLKLCEENDALNYRLAKSGQTERARQIQLGFLLRDNHDRIFGNLRLEKAYDTKDKRNKYRLKEIEIAG